jgi:hypothetical protein
LVIACTLGSFSRLGLEIKIESCEIFPYPEPLSDKCSNRENVRTRAAAELDRNSMLLGNIFLKGLQFSSSELFGQEPLERNSVFLAQVWSGATRRRLEE